MTHRLISQLTVNKSAWAFPARIFFSSIEDFEGNRVIKMAQVQPVAAEPYPAR